MEARIAREGGREGSSRSARRRRLRPLGAALLRRWGGPFALVATTLALSSRTAMAGQCVFRQTCVGGLDGKCTPEPTDPTIYPNGTLANASFPLDASHGFGLAHDGVWNGDIADQASGYRCQDITAGDPVSGRCLKDGLASVPVVCPQYKDDGCCTWEQNYVLYQNLQTLVATFGGAQGCTACAVNLVNLWCGIICSPDQAAFQQLHDPPFDTRRDDLTDGWSRVLQVELWLAPSYACRLFDSCKSTSIVGSVTGMQSGLGLLTYQAQTGAVGHGEYFLLNFDNTTQPQGTSSSQAGGGDGASQSKRLLFSQETLECSSFYEPGSTTVPYPYPPPNNTTLTHCSCTYCQSSCASLNVGVSTSASRPISPLTGLDWSLVLGAYGAIAALAMALAAYRHLTTAKTGYYNSSSSSRSSSSSPLLSLLDDGESNSPAAGDEEEQASGGGRLFLSPSPPSTSSSSSSSLPSPQEGQGGAN